MWSRSSKFVSAWSSQPNLQNFGSYVSTRWGTWFESTFFLSKNFNQVSMFFGKHKLEYAIINHLITTSLELKKKLTNVLMFDFCQKKIKWLEKSNIYMKDQSTCYLSMQNMLELQRFITDLPILDKKCWFGIFYQQCQKIKSW